MLSQDYLHQLQAREATVLGRQTRRRGLKQSKEPFRFVRKSRKFTNELDQESNVSGLVVPRADMASVCCARRLPHAGSLELALLWRECWGPGWLDLLLRCIRHT